MEKELQIFEGCFKVEGNTARFMKTTLKIIPNQGLDGIHEFWLK